MPVPDSPVSLSFAPPWSVSKPSKPLTHRSHKPGHRHLRRMHLDEVHTSIHVDPFLRAETEAASSGEGKVPLPRSRHRLPDPLGVLPPAELVSSPDGQPQPDPSP